MIHPVQKSSYQLTSGFGTIGVEFLYFEALNLQAMMNRNQIRTGGRKSTIKNDLFAIRKKSRTSHPVLYCSLNRQSRILLYSVIGCESPMKYSPVHEVTFDSRLRKGFVKFFSTIFRKLFRGNFHPRFRETPAHRNLLLLYSDC